MPCTRRLFTASVGLAALLISPMLIAGVYKCVAANGATTYQERPCTGKGLKQSTIGADATAMASTRSTSSSDDSSADDMEAAPSASRFATPSAGSIKASQLVGSWCIYQASFFGQNKPARITLNINANGQFTAINPDGRSEKEKHDQGEWSLKGTHLTLGDDRMVVESVSPNALVLNDVAKMKARKGGCS